MKKSSTLLICLFLLFSFGIKEVKAENKEYNLRDFYITVPDNFSYEEKDFSISGAIDNGMMFSDIDSLNTKIISVDIFDNYFLKLDDTLDLEVISEENAEKFWEFYKSNLNDIAFEYGYEKIGNIGSYYQIISNGDGDSYTKNNYIFYDGYMYNITSMVSDSNFLEEEFKTIMNSIYVGEREEEKSFSIYYLILGAILSIGLITFIIIKKRRKKDVWK